MYRHHKNSRNEHFGSNTNNLVISFCVQNGVVKRSRYNRLLSFQLQIQLAVGTPVHRSGTSLMTMKSTRPQSPASRYVKPQHSL